MCFLQQELTSVPQKLLYLVVSNRVLRANTGRKRRISFTLYFRNSANTTTRCFKTYVFLGLFEHPWCAFVISLHVDTIMAPQRCNIFLRLLPKWALASAWCTRVHETYPSDVGHPWREDLASSFLSQPLPRLVLVKTGPTKPPWGSKRSMMQPWDAIPL